MAKERSYYEFAHLIDIDEFEQAIGFEVLRQHKDEDEGQCFDLYGLHKNGDTTGKLAINREKKVVHCWVCGGSNLLGFTMDLFDMSVVEATEWLGQFARYIEPSDEDFLAEIDGLLARETSHSELKEPPWFNENILRQFDGHHPWFDDHVSPQAKTELRLGFDAQHQRLAPKRGDERIDDPYVGPAIILPHFWGGRLVGYQERWLDYPVTPKWLPKYTNTHDFPKSFTLYNFDRAKVSRHPVVVLESVTSVLVCESLGIPAVATFGSSVNEEQLRHLRTLHQGVIIARDNDAPGEKFEARLVPYLDQFIPVRWTPLTNLHLHEGDNITDLHNLDDIRHAIRTAPVYTGV